MSLNSNAIITVQQFLDFTDQTQVLSDAFSIYNTSGSNTTATVAVSDTALTLVGSGTGTDAFTLANASYDTMTELTAAITALSEGWQVELLGDGAVASTTLVPFAATDVYGQTQTIVLRYSNTAIIEEWINTASQAIETYLGTCVVARTGIREWVDGRGDTDLVLRNWPVTSVTRVAYGNDTAFTVCNTDTTALRATVEVQDDRIVLTRITSVGATETVDRAFADSATASAFASYISGLDNDWTVTVYNNCLMADLRLMAGVDAMLVDAVCEYPATSAAVRHVDYAAGIVTLQDCGLHAPGRYNYLAEYAAGYALASVPSDIVAACWKLAQALQQSQGTDGGLQSESLGQYSYSRATVSVEQAASFITGDIAGLLWRYRRDGVGL